MPCYQVNLISVEFGGQSERLLEEIGAEVRVDGKSAIWRGVNVDLVQGIARGEQGQINEMKRAYAGAAVRQAARKNGWTVKKVNEREYVALKY